MSFSATTALVTPVFAAQIMVLSIWAPFQLHEAYSRLKHQYPPSDYPRLYPVAPLTNERFTSMLLVVRLVIVLASMTLFAVELFAGRGPHTLARTLVWSLLAQSVPALMRLPWQLALARAFRAMPPPPVRSAELRPTRLTEFVPLPLIAAGMAAAAASMVGAVTLYVGDPESRVMTLFC